MTPAKTLPLPLGGGFRLEADDAEDYRQFGLDGDGVTGMAAIYRGGKLIDLVLVFRSRWDYLTRPDCQTN